MAQQPTLLQGPAPVETTDLHFKLICKLKVFESDAKYEDGFCSLLAVSQHYGLIFAGTINGFSVIKTKTINSATKYEEYPKRDVILNLKPSQISVDFSQKILSVVVRTRPLPTLILYNIASFTTKNLTPLKVIPLSKAITNAVAEVVELQWQPNPDSNLIICMSDGSMAALNQEAKEGIVATLPHTNQATCFCWSPKGKQIVVGSANGTLSQYKPDLKLVKTIPAPPLFNGAVTVVNVLWTSSFQFVVAYNDRNSPESSPVIAVVNAAKNEPISVINYDDITYSSTLFRQHQIYMLFQSVWNLIFVSSANSIEVAVLHSKGNLAWEQWLLGDASRAELPLNPEKQETFPLGFAFDFTSVDTIPWGEGTLPPMPRLLLLSDEGVLCVFNIVNLTQDAPQLCGPPKENVDDSLFNISTSAFPAAPETPGVIQMSKSFTGQPATVVGSAKPSFGFDSNPTFGGFMTQSPGNTPQVTISIQGGPVLGTVKDASLILQQQQQQKQQQQQQQQVQQQSSLPLQQQPQTQQPPLIMTTPTVSSGIFKFSTTTSSFGTPVAPNFSFRMANTGSSFNNTQPTVTQASLPSQKFMVNQGAVFKSEPTTIITVDPFAGKNLPQSTPIKPAQPVTTAASATATEVAKTIPKKTTDVIVTKAHADDVSGKVQSPSAVPEPVAPDLPPIDDTVYLNALEDEISHFSSELQQLSLKVGSLKVQVGTEEDKANMKKRIDEFSLFGKELKETTESQSSEIHSIVMDLMESFAWLEDAKSRNLQRKNPSFIELKKSEELDPLSARHMSDIAHLKYYIENQLKQLTSYLEKEWMDHQENFRKEIKNRMTVPPLEEVYKTMHYQLKILNKQRTLVEELKEKMAAKKRKNRSQSSVNISSSTTVSNNQETNRISELSKLAENLLQFKISQGNSDSKFDNWELMKSQLKAISDRSKKLTSDKQAALRDMLSERDMVKIRPVRTTLETSSFLRSLLLKRVETKPLKTKSDTEYQKQVEKEKVELSPFQTKGAVALKTKEEIQLKVQPEKSIGMENTKPVVNEPSKTCFVFGTQQTEKSIASPSLTTPSILSKPEEKSPLSSLSWIVSNIGKENEVKPKSPSGTFVFGNSNFQKSDVNKGNVFGSVKPEETKTQPVFSFGVSKPPEPTIQITKKSESPKVDATSTFSLAAPQLSVTSAFTGTKVVTSKGNQNAPISISVATTIAAAAAPPFTFSATTVATQLPKVNLVFSGKDQIPAFGTKPTGNLFAMSNSATQGSKTPIFGTSASVFSMEKPSFDTSTASPTLSFAKTTSESTKPTTGFSFTQPIDNSNTVTGTEPTSKPKPGAEKAEEASKKSELSTPKNSVPLTTVSNFVFGVSTEPVKSVSNTPSVSLPSSQNLQFNSTPQSTVTAVTCASIKTIAATSAGSTTKPASTASQPTTATSVVVSSTATPIAAIVTAVTTSTSSTTAAIVTSSVITTPSTTTAVKTSAATTTVTSVLSSSPTTAATTTPTTTITTSATATATAASTPSGFSFSSSLGFGQNLTTTASTTSTGVFGQGSGAKTTVFGQVSSTTSTTSIFGGGTATTTTASIFGGSSPLAKPVFGQASLTPTTSAVNIFGGSPSTNNTFGQSSTPTSSPSAFGQKPDAVAQTANIFGQLLSDNNRPGNAFGTTTGTATTTANIFSTPKNIFGGASTTTTSLFEKTPSIFPQATSVFGQPTGSASVFGSTQTSTSNSFFGQNICSPFGGSNAATSNQTSFESGSFNSKPIFGQSPGNTSIFGGSQTTSIFGGSSNSSSSGSNVFQTATTSSSFGSTSPGPFSSGQGSVAETGFRAANSFQKPMIGFGSPPVFGGAPAAAPAFGAARTFSGTSSFGSLPSFGSNQASFSQTTGHSATFENLANKYTVGFENLAQQNQTQGFGNISGFGGNSFENKPFGGSSFSTWRSK